jgi:hypothetical protein
VGDACSKHLIFDRALQRHHDHRRPSLGSVRQPPWTLFKERLIYEQSAARTAREQQEKQPCRWLRQPLKIEQLH